MTALLHVAGVVRVWLPLLAAVEGYVGSVPPNVMIRLVGVTVMVCGAADQVTAAVAVWVLPEALSTKLARTVSLPAPLASA